MLNRDTLIEASNRGLIKPDQVAPLFDFLTGVDPQGTLEADPEEMHFARGFHDVFISLGLGILFAGYFFGISFLFSSGTIAFAGAMIVTWLLAEWFSKKLRLSLPSILLTGAFVTFSILAAGEFVETLAGQNGSRWELYDPTTLTTGTWIQVMPFVFGLITGSLFYMRFRVPITPAFLALATAGLFIFSIAVIDKNLLQDYVSLWLLVVGLGALVLAMMFDMRDPMRQTLNSDKAFWLHLVAAPLLVHSILSLFAAADQSAITAIATIIVVIVIGLFALIIDRRALLASAIGYLGFAIGVLLDQINLGEQGVISLTLLMLGVFVLMLGSGWSSLRGFLLRPFADQPLLRRLPPVSPKGH